MDFDEKKAIDFIRQNALKPAGVDYDDDELLNIIDMIYDYYEDHGLLSLDFDDDVDDDAELDDLVQHVTKMLARDKGASVAAEHVPAIVKAEMDYENSLF